MRTITISEKPALRDYDLIVVNSSAGKDSQAMLDALVHQADVEGVERSRIVVVHADLGRAEWAGTRELAAEQAAHYGLRFEVVSRPKGDLLVQIRTRMAKRPDVAPWPSSTNRYCTSDQKRDQIAKVIRALGKELAEPAPRILNCLGIRAQESAARAKKAPFEPNKRLTNSKRAVDDYYPIFDWTEDEVWTQIEASGVRHHWAYDEGMPRLSCAFCVFAPRSALVIAAKHNRALLDEYLAIERDSGYSFRKGFSLQQVADAVDSGEADDVTVCAQEAASWTM